MIGRGILRDLPGISKNQPADYGAGEAFYGLAKTLPSRLAPLRHYAAPRASMVNYEKMTPVLVVRQLPQPAAGKRNQTRMLNRLRSSYTLMPLGGRAPG